MSFFQAEYSLKLGRLLGCILVVLLVPEFCFADGGVDQLIRDRLSKDKKTLDLSGARIGPKGAKTLAGMELLSRVENLFLQGNKIKYRGINIYLSNMIYSVQYFFYCCIITPVAWIRGINLVSP